MIIATFNAPIANLTTLRGHFTSAALNVDAESMRYHLLHLLQFAYILRAGPLSILQTSPIWVDLLNLINDANVYLDAHPTLHRGVAKRIRERCVFLLLLLEAAKRGELAQPVST
jgi:hypothetical protein